MNLIPFRIIIRMTNVLSANFTPSIHDIALFISSFIFDDQNCYIIRDLHSAVAGTKFENVLKREQKSHVEFTDEQMRTR